MHRQFEDVILNNLEHILGNVKTNNDIDIWEKLNEYCTAAYIFFPYSAIRSQHRYSFPFPFCILKNNTVDFCFSHNTMQNNNSTI